MNRLIVKTRWKRYLRARQRYAASARLRKRKHAKLRTDLQAKRTRPYADVDAPAEFSLINNPDGVNELIAKLRREARKSNVAVRLKNVREITIAIEEQQGRRGGSRLTARRETTWIVS